MATELKVWQHHSIQVVPCPFLNQFETSIIAIIEVIIQFQARESSLFCRLKRYPQQGIFLLI